MVRSLVGKHPNYYEAILQLRDVTDEVVHFVKEDIKKYRVPVTKIAKTINGTDYYLADNQYARALGKRLQQYFGGQTIITASLHTQIDGKDKYRVTVLFRGVPFKKGDKVFYQDDQYEIKAMGKDIFMLGKKKVHIRYKDIKQIKLVEE